MNQNLDKKQNLILLSNIIAKELLEKGCMVHRYISQTTNSVYLKIDAGVGKCIRISDHSGRENLKYRYNVRTDNPEEVRIVEEPNDKAQYFFTETNILSLVQLIMKEKQQMLKKYGFRSYIKFINKDLDKTEQSHGFWRNAQILLLKNILEEVKLYEN